MSETTYRVHDERGISREVDRERASRLSRAGLWVTAVTTGVGGDE